MEKVNVILDTDISNEIDDQFALTYLMKSQDKVNLKAITIAPFQKTKYSQVESLEEGINISFVTAGKILDLLGEGDYKKIIYKGAKEYFYQSKEINPAVEKIIKEARENDKLTIIAIGAITNAALALYHAPDIKTKISIVWLGGHSFLSNTNREFNFRQDVEAVKYVFGSKVDLTVIPCRNVASSLSTTIYELNHFLLGCGEIGSYLCKIFEDCKRAFRKNENDYIGEDKVLWDMSAVAYVLNSDWFDCQKVSCPKICKDLTYKRTRCRHKINFVANMNRQKIFSDYFVKMGYKG